IFSSVFRLLCAIVPRDPVLDIFIFCYRYVAHSFNFFLFPTTFGVMDSEFSFQASSIQFLTHYGFDYNKFLKDGIPYMNQVQEKKLQQGLLAGNWKVRSTLDKDKVKKVIDEVTRWVTSAEEGGSMVLHDISGTADSETGNSRCLDRAFWRPEGKLEMKYVCACPSCGDSEILLVL
uniref:Uncharacterized protein n=1 Tax=Chelydra serpentina TaxID=8475 RepID=A0A8C3TC58_CHESE